MKRYKYVQTVHDRHTGKPRYYFRPRGERALPLPDAYGSHDFELEHGRLLLAHETTQRVIKHVGRPAARGIKHTEGVAHLPGSIAAFVKEWRTSSEFKDKSQGTRYNYGKALDYLSKRRGTVRLDETTTQKIDEYSRTVDSVSGADLQVQMIKALWDFSRGSPHFRSGDRPNPAIGARKRYKVKRGFLEWPADIQAKFLAAAKPHVRLLFHLLRETGQRLGDVALMQWTHYDGETIMIVGTEKTDNPVYVQVSATLRNILDAMPRTCPYILSKNGQRLAKGTLSHAIGRTLTKIGYGRRGTAKDTYSAHGLRKNLASEMAMAGANVPSMQAQLGHKTARMALYYAQQADSKRLAAEAMQKVNAARQRAVTLAQDDVIDLTQLRPSRRSA